MEEFSSYISNIIIMAEDLYLSCYEVNGFEDFFVDSSYSSDDTVNWLNECVYRFSGLEDIFIPGEEERILITISQKPLSPIRMELHSPLSLDLTLQLIDKVQYLLSANEVNFFSPVSF